MGADKKIKYYGSPRWSYEFLDCAVPMTFDTYNLCSYQCLYCFSYFQRRFSEDYAFKKIRHVNVKKVKEIFLKPESSKFSDYVKARIPMQWGGLSEPFDLAEPKLGITLELLKFFREIDYPITFSTKSVWWVFDERYKKVIKGARNFHFKWSIITLDQEKARLIERFVPSPEARLKAMGEVNKWGTAGVVLRLRPFIIGISDPTYLDLIRESAKNGARAISTEFFCLEGRATMTLKKRYMEMSRVCGYDLWNFYRLNTRTSGYWRLNYEVKRPYVEAMEKLCQELGIGFYVSDAHHKERCAFGNCCGLPQDNYFSGYAKCQFTQAIVIARQKGKVRFSDISQEYHLFLEKSKAEDAHKMLAGGEKIRYKTLFDYMRTVWNQPKKLTSPFKYFNGLLLPAGLDKNGDIIYKFNQEKYEG